MTSKKDQIIDVALDRRGNLTAEGEEHKFALVWRHKDESKQTKIVRVDNIIDFNPQRPIYHYYVKWVNENGEKSLPICQVMVVAETVEKIEEYLADPNTRLIYSTRRVSGAREMVKDPLQTPKKNKKQSSKGCEKNSREIMKPIETPKKNEKQSSKSCGQNAENKGNGSKDHSSNRRLGPKKQQKTKFDISEEEYDVNEKAQKLNKLQIDEEGDACDLEKIQLELIRSQESLEKSQAKIQKLREELSERDANLRYLQNSLSKAQEKISNLENLDAGDLEQEIMDRDLEILSLKKNLEEARKKIQELQDLINQGPSKSVSGKGITKPAKPIPQLKIGEFTQEQKKELKDREKLDRFAEWKYYNETTKKDVKMIHLYYGQSLEKAAYDDLEARYKPKKLKKGQEGKKGKGKEQRQNVGERQASSYLSELLAALVGGKAKLGNYACRVDKTTSKVDDKERESLEMGIIACAKRMYQSYIRKYVAKEDQDTLLKTFHVKVSTHINNAHARIKKGVQDVKVEDVSASSPSPSPKKLERHSRVNRCLANEATNMTQTRPKSSSRPLIQQSSPALSSTRHSESRSPTHLKSSKKNNNPLVTDSTPSSTSSPYTSKVRQYYSSSRSRDRRRISGKQDMSTINRSNNWTRTSVSPPLDRSKPESKSRPLSRASTPSVSRSSDNSSDRSITERSPPPKRSRKSPVRSRSNSRDSSTNDLQEGKGYRIIRSRTPLPLHGREQGRSRSSSASSLVGDQRDRGNVIRTQEERNVVSDSSSTSSLAEEGKKNQIVTSPSPMRQLPRERSQSPLSAVPAKEADRSVTKRKRISSSDEEECDARSTNLLLTSPVFGKATPKKPYPPSSTPVSSTKGRISAAARFNLSAKLLEKGKSRTARESPTKKYSPSTRSGLPLDGSRNPKNSVPQKIGESVPGTRPSPSLLDEHDASRAFIKSFVSKKRQN